MSHDQAVEAIQRWKAAGVELDRLRREELQQFSHAENAEAIDQLLAAGLLHAQPRPSSGMVEMQRILMKAKR